MTKHNRDLTPKVGGFLTSEDRMINTNLSCQCDVDKRFWFQIHHNVERVRCVDNIIWNLETHAVENVFDAGSSLSLNLRGKCFKRH